MAIDYKTDVHVCGHTRTRSFSMEVLCLTASASVVQLSFGSQSNIVVEGDTPGQVIDLPDATECLFPGHEYCFFNESSQILTIRDFEDNLLREIPPNSTCCFYLKDNSTPGGIWLEKKTALSKVSINTESVSGVSGGNAEEFIFNYLEIAGIPVKNETAGGIINCINLDYITAFEFIGGTLEVKIDGSDLDPNKDFLEGPDNKSFSLIIDPDDVNMASCPPFDDETILINYCRRVIF